MRYTAWKKTDFFHPHNNIPIEMDADVVILPESGSVPIGLNFNPMEPPIGRFTDIRVEDGEITGEAEWFENSGWDDERMADKTIKHRLGVYVSHVKRDGYRITKATLREVDVMLEDMAPKR